MLRQLIKTAKKIHHTLETKCLKQTLYLLKKGHKENKLLNNAVKCFRNLPFRNVFGIVFLSGSVSDAVTSLDGTQLDPNLKCYEETLKRNRLNLFNNYFIDGEKRSDVSIPTLFVTAEERAVAEDIKNSTKDEILRRVSDKLQQISDEEIREPLSQKLDHLRRNITKSKKEILVIFYNEILEELQQAQSQQETAYVVEEEGQSE